MSIDSITGDDFLRLDADDHRTALYMYEVAIESRLQEVADYRAQGAQQARDQALDRLTSQLQLRKMHRVRLQELVEDEGQQGPAANQSFNAEIDQLPS